MQTTQKQYVLNLETSKIELQFEKSDYLALSEEEKSMLKRAFLFSGKQKAWVSRSKNNHYSAINAAEKLGFTNGGKTGERLSFAEQLEREAEKAENRAERFQEYAQNAEKRASNLQSEFNELRKDWSWVTQPNINSSSGRSFTNQRNRVIARYEKGFDEYRKSEYYKERAETAQQTADHSKLKNRSYLSNRIEETNKDIRHIQTRIVNAENNNNDALVSDLVDKMEYHIDKLAYLHNCLDEIGGIQYSKDNVKPGYLVRVRREWQLVVKANPKTVELQSNYVSYTLKYPYAEIQEMKIPENYQEPKEETPENPYKINDIVIFNAIGSNRIIRAFQVIKTTAKNVAIQEIDVINNDPQLNSFKSDKQMRKAVKKDRNGNDVLNYESWYLYKHINS